MRTQGLFVAHDNPKKLRGLADLRRPDLRKAEADLRAANFDIGAAPPPPVPPRDKTRRKGTHSGQTKTQLETGPKID